MFMQRLSNDFKALKDEYMHRKQAGDDYNKVILERCSALEQNYEIGLKQKLEDTASIILQTGGISERQKMECRKLPFFGDAGDTYFEQPSINLILSGLWSCAHLKPKLVRI